MPEEPEYSEAEAKAYAMETPGVMLKGLLARLAQRDFGNDKQYGFVNWDATTPAGNALIDHRQSFAEAVYTALQLAETDFTDEWLIVGRGGVVILRTVRDFSFNDKQTLSGDPRLIGRLKDVDVYFSNKMPCNEFCAGCGLRYSRGLLSNLPFHMVPPPDLPPLPADRPDPLHRFIEAGQALRAELDDEELRPDRPGRPLPPMPEPGNLVNEGWPDPNLLPPPLPPLEHAILRQPYTWHAKATKAAKDAAEKLAKDALQGNADQNDATEPPKSPLAQQVEGARITFLTCVIALVITLIAQIYVAWQKLK